tara:strand:- start:12190 stop:12729 length:540 start_codon:yes stop_codon:yes gene_type:complete
MFIQTETTPNPNSLKFVPGRKISLVGPIEITDISQTNNELIRNILSIDGVTGVFLSDNFISVNKKNDYIWEDLKHIIISFINDFFSQGNNVVISESYEQSEVDTSTVEGQIKKILDTKIRPAVARDGGDIKFKDYKNGIVRVELQGACSGCPSATLTLKQGVQNLLCHYIPEVKEVEAV